MFGVRPEYIHHRNEVREVTDGQTANVSVTVVEPLGSEVYAYLADFERHVEWAHTYLNVEPPRDRPLRVGSRLVIHEKQNLRWDKPPRSTISDRPGPEYTTLVEIKTLEAGRRISWSTRYQGGPLESVRGEWEFVLEPVEARITTVRFRAALLGPREVLAGYGADLLQRGYPVDILARQVDRAMHNIRTILESR